MGRGIHRVINIDVPDDEVVARLSGRRTCKSCGAMYHVKFNPPRKKDVCDKCGGGLYQRDDDNEKTIRSRLQVYHDQTSPLKSYYGKKGLVKDIPGVGDIAGITSAVIKALES
jgi:adenylate kinase